MPSKNEIENLRASLRHAKEKLQEQDAFIQRVMESPSPYATVIKTVDDRCVLGMSGSKMLEVSQPEDFKVKPGQTVKLVGETMQIIEVIEEMDLGEVCIVKGVLDDGKAEIDYNGSTRLVDCSLVGKVEDGDRIVVDTSGFAALRNLGSKSSRFQVNEETGVSWDDVGGLKEAKRAMIEAVELPFKYPDLYKGYGKSRVKGLMLHGPPGCGKTMLAKACATSLSDVHGTFHSSGFIYVKGPEVLSKWVGQSEATIRSLFARARKHKEKHGYPAVLFIDEADALFGKRGSEGTSFMSRTIVPQFLSEMDGFDDSSAVVLLSTNRPDTLDSAVVRDGRIDRKIHVPRPDKTAAEAIFRLHVDGKALSKGYSAAEAAETGVEALFDPSHAFYRVEMNNGDEHVFGLRHVLNGAMIASIIDQSCAHAMRRDLEDKSSKPSGIIEDDIILAVEDVFKQNVGLNHDEELRDFMRPLDGKPKAVETLT